MTPQQNLALTIHEHSCHPTATPRDSDLVRLVEVWPGLQRVFEELQALRDRVDALQDEVDDLQDENTGLRAELDER